MLNCGNIYYLTIYYLPFSDMLKTFLLCVVIIGLCIVMLSVRILLKKNGQFVKTHVSQSKAMRERGIGCVQGQDFAARHKRKRVRES